MKWDHRQANNQSESSRRIQERKQQREIPNSFQSDEDSNYRVESSIKSRELSQIYIRGKCSRVRYLIISKQKTEISARTRIDS